MKKPLHHAIVRAPYGGQRVVAVTTERTNGNWYGRIVSDSQTTHGTRRDVISRHQTEAEALSRLAVMSSIEEQYTQRSRCVVSLTRRLQQMREDAIRDAATGAVPPPMDVPVVLWSDTPITAPFLMQIAQQFLDQDDATHFGAFERELQELLERHTP